MLTPSFKLNAASDKARVTHTWLDRQAILARQAIQKEEDEKIFKALSDVWRIAEMKAHGWIHVWEETEVPE